MSGLDNLKTRLVYAGGVSAEKRFQKDKLRALRKAMLYSYQAATALLSDGREFRCLINSSSVKEEYDIKTLSIPYRDICLNRAALDEEEADAASDITSIVDSTEETVDNEEEVSEEEETINNIKTTEGLEEIGLKPGDVFIWKETNTHWLIYLQYLEEDAYFRANICRCDQAIEVNDNTYWVYLRGPVETDIIWNQGGNKSWNELNYSLVMYITKNEETEQYFHRFAKVKILGKTWKVETVNPYYGDGIIQVCLDEYFNNTIEEEEIKRQQEEAAAAEEEEEEIDSTTVVIQGESTVYPYDELTYSVTNSEGGDWSISDSRKAAIVETDSSLVKVRIISGKSGSFVLSYIKGVIEAEKKITIKSI